MIQSNKRNLSLQDKRYTLPEGVERMKKMITLVTAASLVMGSMAVPVYGATFADINTVT